MATQIVTISKADGWKKISEASKVYGVCHESSVLRQAWSAERPADDFQGYLLAPGTGGLRDFETGDLYLKLPNSSSLLDQVDFVFDEG